MKPLVSILIPCYNAEAWLEETLESALAQTWENKEIILVDDGSKDRSLEIAKRFESRGVKVISQSNRGASAARNRALQECQGDFIQYLDADDLLAPDKIERQVQILGDKNSEFVVSGEWARFYQNPSEALFVPQPLWKDMSPIDWLICSWEGQWMMHPGAWLLSRHIVEKAGVWNESLSLDDDGEYFCRIVLASKTVKFCSGAKSFYRSGNINTLSSSKSETAWKSLFQSVELGMNNLLAQENCYRTRHACATRLQRFIYEVYPNVPDQIDKAEAMVEKLGGSDLKPCGGPIFQLFCYLVGWKKTQEIKHWTYSLNFLQKII